jgi:protein KRI1
MDLGLDEDFHELKINEDFAKRFEHNKRRELLDKARQKYGEQALLDSEKSEESESSSSDDSEAELLNERVESKFLQVIDAIRSKDKDRLNKLAKGDPNANIFDDEDFENERVAKSKKTKFTLKD